MSDTKRLLTQAEVDSLPEAARVSVTWSGGNGPHAYRIVRDKHAGVCVDNVYRDALRNVGGHPLTQVWLLEGS
jgi:hypothetical protein